MNQGLLDFLSQYDLAGGTGNLLTGGNNALYQKMAGDLAGLVNFQGPATVPKEYTTELMNEGGPYQATMQGFVPNPALLDALKGYSAQQEQGQYSAGLLNPAGQSVGTFNSGDKSTSFDKFAETAIPIAMMALAGQAAGGLFPGAEGAAGGASGAVGAPSYASALGSGAADAALYAAPSGGVLGGQFAGMSLAELNAASAALGGAAGGAVVGGSAPSYASIAGPSAADVSMYAAPSGGAMGGQFAGMSIPELNAASAALGGVASAPTVAPQAFNAAKDSQLASSQLGITGADAAAAATAPASVDLGSLGGTMATGATALPTTGLDPMRQGEIASYQTNGSMPSSPAVSTTGGGLLGQLGSTVSDAAAWMKANPMLGKLIMAGGTSLLSSGALGGGGSSAPAQDYGPAKQWGSPLQQGLLGQVQQTMPAAIQQRPAGLLAQGNANSGAWRFLGGK